MRIVGGIIISFTAAMLIPVSIQYVGTMVGLETQIIRFPRWCVFVCFPVTFIIMGLRTVVRLIIDIKSAFHHNYAKLYPQNKEKKVR